MNKEGETKKKQAKPSKTSKAPVKKEGDSGKSKGARDIGVNVNPPDRSCNDKDCPFHGTLPVRGQIIEGVVISDRMQNTVVVKKDYRRYIPKYERYEWRHGKYVAHNPSCINARVGASVRIMECRPLSKTKSFVIIEQTVTK